MAKEAPKVPVFAAYLRQQRGDRSRESIVRQMASVNVQRDQSALAKAEIEGRVPAVDLLRGANAVYKVTFEGLVDKVLNELGVTPVKWRVAASNAAEVVRDNDEVDLLQVFRKIDPSEDRLRRLLIEMVERFVDDWANGLPKTRSTRMREKLVDKPSDEPTITRRKR